MISFHFIFFGICLFWIVNGDYFTIYFDKDDVDEAILFPKPKYVSNNETLLEYFGSLYPDVNLMIPKRYTAFQLDPVVILNWINDEISYIVHLNAERSLYDGFRNDTWNILFPNEEPIFTLWVLCTSENDFKYSNQRLVESSWKNRVRTKIFDFQNFDLIISQNGINHIAYNGIRLQPPDIVLPRIGSKISHFGLAIIRQLEAMENVVVLNGFKAHLMASDKLYQLQMLGSQGFPIPKTLMFRDTPAKEEIYQWIQRELEFPAVMKLLQGLQGKGVALISDSEQLRSIEDMMDETKPHLVQEFVSNSYGRDIRVFIIGGKAVGAMMRISKEGFKSNFHQGGSVKMVKLTEPLEWLSAEAAHLLDLDVAGVDLLIDHDNYRICEINSSPGYEGFELATGIDIPVQFIEFMKVKLNLWRRQMRKHYQR